MTKEIMQCIVALEKLRGTALTKQGVIKCLGHNGSRTRVKYELQCRHYSNINKFIYLTFEAPMVPWVHKTWTPEAAHNCVPVPTATAGRKKAKRNKHKSVARQTLTSRHTSPECKYFFI